LENGAAGKVKDSLRKARAASEQGQPAAGKPLAGKLHSQQESLRQVRGNRFPLSVTLADAGVHPKQEQQRKMNPRVRGDDGEKHF
jgi:hypothetical protein